jgi:hypothetical protein
MEGRRATRHQRSAKGSPHRLEALPKLVRDPLGKERARLAGKGASPGPVTGGIVEQGLGHAPLW